MKIRFYYFYITQKSQRVLIYRAETNGLILVMTALMYPADINKVNSNSDLFKLQLFVVLQQLLNVHLGIEMSTGGSCEIL